MEEFNQKSSATPMHGASSDRHDVTDDQLRATIYFAVGVASESMGRAYTLSVAGSPVGAKKLTVADDSGYSIGTIQTDLGQHYQPGVRNGENVPRDLVDTYQDWARANHGSWVLGEAERMQTIDDLGRKGHTIFEEHGRPIDATIQTHINEFLESADGIAWVHQRDVAQVNKLMDGAIAPLKTSRLYQNAPEDDQIRLAAIVSKAYNQNELRSRSVLDAIRRYEYRSVDEVGEAIGLLGPKRKDGKENYFESGRDDALRGADIVNSLRHADPTNPLLASWKNVSANPLVNPAQLEQAQGNLAAEYPTIKTLFIHHDQAQPFIHALDHGGSFKYMPTHKDHFSGAGLVAESKDFVVWGTDGQGHAFINNTWSPVHRDELSVVQNPDHSRDLSITQNGTTHALLRVAQPVPERVHHVTPGHKGQANRGIAPDTSPQLRDFSDSSHPQNALYNTLKAGFPSDTTPAWLACATAACYMSGIKQPDDLGNIYGNGEKIMFMSNSLFALSATIDTTQPPPTVQQTMQQVQQFDQQHAQRMSEIRTQNAHVNAHVQQAPTR